MRTVIRSTKADRCLLVNPLEATDILAGKIPAFYTQRPLKHPIGGMFVFPVHVHVQEVE